MKANTTTTTSSSSSSKKALLLLSWSLSSLSLLSCSSLTSATSFEIESATSPLAFKSSLPKNINIPSDKYINFNVDQSYDTKWDPIQISKAIQEFYSNRGRDGGGSAINIDVSNSLILDEGLQTIFDSILHSSSSSEHNDEHNQHDNILSVSLEARMNRLTAKGVAAFFDRIIDTMKINNEKVPTNTDTDTVTESNEINQNENNKLEQNSKEPKSQKMKNIPTRIHFQYIDFGFNDIGLHGVDVHVDSMNTSSNSKHKKQNNNDHTLLFTSIRKLIEHSVGVEVERETGERSSPTYTTCPTVLRFDNCGLGPPFCRAIGKVSDEKSSTFIASFMYFDQNFATDT